QSCALPIFGLLWMSVAPPASPDLSQFAVLRRPPFLLLSIGLACRNQQDLAGYTAKPLPKRRGDGHARAEQPAVAPARAAQRRPSTRPSAVRGAACWPPRRPAAGLPAARRLGRHRPVGRRPRAASRGGRSIAGARVPR